MTCGVCEEQPDGIHLCPGCRDKLTDNLRRVESTVEAIWTAAARQNVGAGSVGTSGHSAPADPTNSRAYDAGRTLNTILTGWARALGHTQPHAIKAANVLLTHIREVREQDWAPVLHQELAEALTDCDRATDRAAPRISLGRCGECPGEVIAIEGEPFGYCRACDMPRNVKSHQQYMISEAWHVRAPLPQILRALKYAGHASLRMSRVEWWIKNGKLAPVEGNLFTPADVLRAYWETPAGKKERPESYPVLGVAA